MYLNNKIAVVVPVYNEEKSISQVVKSMPQYIDHIIVVDDGSTDTTMSILETLANNKGVFIISHHKKKGVGSAITTGYKKAIDLKAHVILVMAGDGQMDPEDVPKLLMAIIEQGADYAKGNRFYRFSNLKKMPIIRIIGNVLLSLLTKPCSGYWHVFDSQCGFTAITSHALKKINLNRFYHGYGFPNSLLVELGLEDCEVIDVPVKAIYDQNYSKMVLLRDVPLIFCLLVRLFLIRFYFYFLRPVLFKIRIGRFLKSFQKIHDKDY